MYSTGTACYPQNPADKSLILFPKITKSVSPPFDFFLPLSLYMGPGVAQWLRHCATSRAVPESNPGGVGHREFSLGYRQNHVPGVNSASKKWVPGIPLWVKAAGVWGWRPTTLVVPNIKKSGALTYPDPLGPSRRPVVGETFTFTLPLSPYSRYLPQTLTCSQLVKNLIFYITRSLITAFSTARHLSYPKPDQSIPCLP